MIFPKDLKNAYFQIPIHSNSLPSLRNALDSSLLVQGALLPPFHTFPGLYQSVFSGVRMDSQGGGGGCLL